MLYFSQHRKTYSNNYLLIGLHLPRSLYFYEPVGFTNIQFGIRWSLWFPFGVYWFFYRWKYHCPFYFSYTELHCKKVGYTLYTVYTGALFNYESLYARIHKINTHHIKNFHVNEIWLSASLFFPKAVRATCFCQS